MTQLKCLYVYPRRGKGLKRGLKKKQPDKLVLQFALNGYRRGTYSHTVFPLNLGETVQEARPL